MLTAPQSDHAEAIAAAVASVPATAGLPDDERAALEAFCTALTGRPDLLEDAVAADWRDIPLAPGQAPGRAGLLALIASLDAALSDVAVVIHEVIGAPGFHHLERGRIARTWHLEDWFGWLTSMGATWSAPQTAVGVMRAARIHGYGEAPVLEDVATPEPGPGDVLVEVAAASLNPLDVKLQKGLLREVFPVDAFPYTIGTDLSGTIQAVGADVTVWSAGDRVVARLDPTSGGAAAELAVVPAAYLVRAPSSVPLADAAGIPTAGATAWQALFDTAHLQAGQAVLVHAGAGGVGSFAIQLAKAAGARVVATASGDGIAIARGLGADEVIDHRSVDFAQAVHGMDVVLDTVGGDTTARSLDVLRPGGDLVSIPAPPDPALAAGRDVTVLDVYHQSDAELLAKVVDRVQGGTRVLVDRRVGLEQLGEAFARQASGRARGKVLLAM